MFGFLSNSAQAGALADEILSLFQHEALKITVFAAMLFVYAFVMWHFYRNLSKRNLFAHKVYIGKKNAAFKNFASALIYALKFIFLFPIITSFWFAVLSLMLFLLARTQATEVILLISITIISATRIAAYYKEELARELAKLIPLVLLGVFLVQPDFFSLNTFYLRVSQVPAFLENIIVFVLYIIALELVLKVLRKIKVLATGENEQKVSESANK